MFSLVRENKPPPKRNIANPMTTAEIMKVDGFVVTTLRYHRLSEKDRYDWLLGTGFFIFL